jgi:threonine dehydrogenase-like Zn-dependent dehydrogenase
MTRCAWTNLPRQPLDDAAAAYEMFQRKASGAVKIMLKGGHHPVVIIQ